jgi:hypothetical protein
MEKSIIDFSFYIYDSIIGPFFNILFYSIIVVAFPLSFFEKTKILSVAITRAGSAVFFLGGWVYSFGVALNFTGWVGLVLGLLFAGVGHIGVAFTSALMNGSSGFAGGVAFPIALGFISLYFAKWLEGEQQPSKSEA